MNKKFWVLLGLVMVTYLPVVNISADNLTDAFQQGQQAASGGAAAGNAINSTGANTNIPGYTTSPKEAQHWGDGKVNLSGTGMGKQANCTLSSTSGFDGKECDAINFLGSSRLQYPIDRDDALFNLSDGITKDNRDAITGLNGGAGTGGCTTVEVKNPDLESTEHCEEFLEPVDKRCAIGRIVKVDKDANYQCEVTTAQKVNSECHKKLSVSCKSPTDGCDATGVQLASISSDMSWSVSKSSGNSYITLGTIADNYWGTGIYDRTTTFNISKISDVSLFKIDHAWFDDWLWVKVNGTTVYVGPYGGTKLDTDIYSQRCTDEYCWSTDIKTGAWLAANGYSKYGSSYRKSVQTCSNEWGWNYCTDTWTYYDQTSGRVCYTDTACGGWELSTSWNINLDINIRPYLREGSNTIWMRTVVAGGGEGAIRMVTRQYCPPDCTDTWTDGCSGYNR